MRASSRLDRRPSKPSEEQSCKFGTVVRALWPDKPALNLAQRVGCTERAASFYINGERKPTARTVLVVTAAMLE